jgi:hypothetical protein
LVDLLIEKKTLEWEGHLARMDHRGVVEKIFEGKPEGSRRGKFSLRWLEDVEKNVQGLSRKYPAILNISRTVLVTLM